MRRSAAIAAVLLVGIALWGAQEPPRESPPRPPRQPRGSSSSDASRRAPSNAAQRQDPRDIIPLPPRPPRERPNKFLVKLRGAATVAAAERGVRIVQNGGYPELRVDGAPFFIHSAEFPYPRIPRDLWETALDHHRQLGINTIALSIPWNWHEPQEGQADFEGRSNPRRDLRALLRMIAEREFKLIARVSAAQAADWPFSGYPEWLLARPEFKIPRADLVSRRFPPGLRADGGQNAPADTQQLVRLAAARQWLPQVFRELSSYAPRATLQVPQVAAKKGEPTEKEISGPLLLLQVDAGGKDEELEEYLTEFRKALGAAGLDSAQLFVAPRDERARGDTSVALPSMGRWFYTPQASATEQVRGVTIPLEQLEMIEPAIGALGTQPDFPAMLIAYQAGGPAPPDEPRPVESPPANTLLSSRLMLAHGLRGLNHFPLMDGITPAGYELPGANRYARWDAALNAEGDAQPRARAVARTGQLLETWEQFLGSSHKRADFGLLCPSAVIGGELDALQMSTEGACLRLMRAARNAGLASELLDAARQPADQLMRHALILAPVVETRGPQLSETAQHALVEYVRRGGTLAFFPRRPAGEILQQLWSGAVEEPGASAIATAVRKFGQGKVIEAIEPDDKGTLTASESENVTRALSEFMHRAGTQRVVERKSAPDAIAGLVVSQIVSNAGSSPLGGRTAGSGLLSVTNLGETEATQQLQFLPPSLGARSARQAGDQRVGLSVTVPVSESLLLPLSFPLCSTAAPGDRCSDEVIASGAELLRVERDGKVLELTMYVPAKAMLRLKLAQQPARVRVDEIGPQGAWTPGSRTFEVDVLRGAAPDYLRVVKVHLPYTPFVPEKPDRQKPVRRDFDFAVTDAVRLPLAADASLLSYPPLVVLNDDLTGRFIVEVQNYDEMGRDMDVKVDGPVSASDGMGMDAGELRHERVDVKPPPAAARPNSASVAKSQPPLPAQLEVRSGRDTRRSPISFLAVGKEGVVPYRYDFDRDTADEWVLEDDYLRLVVSPESGGRLLAVVDKDSGLSLTNAVGMLRDSLASDDLSHAAYAASWLKEEKATALRLQHAAADGAQIEKTVRLTGQHEFEFSYRVLAATGAASRGAAGDAEAGFTTAASVPVVMHKERTTRFCWPRSPAPAPATATDKASEEDLRCETFVPGGRIEVPAGISALQVRTPGSFAQRLEWQGGGQMIIEMKQYTALLKLQLPLPGDGSAVEFKVKYKMVVVE